MGGELSVEQLEKEKEKAARAASQQFDANFNRSRQIRRGSRDGQHDSRSLPPPSLVEHRLLRAQPRRQCPSKRPSCTAVNPVVSVHPLERARALP